MRTVVANVSKAKNTVFESADDDFQAIHTDCEDFDKLTPESKATAHNDSSDNFAWFKIIFAGNAQRCVRAGILKLFTM